MKTYQIGNKSCFSVQGAIEYFKLIATRCYKDLSMESSVILSLAADDLHREIGLSYSEIESIELSCIAQRRNYSAGFFLSIYTRSKEVKDSLKML